MSDESKDTSNDAQDLAKVREQLIESVAQQLRAMYELKRDGTEQVFRAGGSMPFNSRMPPSPNAGHALFDFARASLLGYENLLNFGQRQFDVLVNALHGRQAHQKATTLYLVSLQGQPAISRFKIENPFSSRARVSFGEPKLLSVDGPQRLRTDVLFSRASLDNAEPGCEFLLNERAVGRFQLTIPLDKDCPVGTYRGESTVTVEHLTAGELYIDLKIGPQRELGKLDVRARKGDVVSEKLTVKIDHPEESSISLVMPVQFMRLADGEPLKSTVAVRRVSGPRNTSAAEFQLTIVLDLADVGQFVSDPIVLLNNAPVGRAHLTLSIDG